METLQEMKARMDAAMLRTQDELQAKHRCGHWPPRVPGELTVDPPMPPAPPAPKVELSRVPAPCAPEPLPAPAPAPEEPRTVTVTAYIVRSKDEHASAPRYVFDRAEFRRIRLARGMDQTSFGRLLGIHSGPAVQISNYENGKKLPRAARVLAWAETLGIHESRLLRRTTTGRGRDAE